jgi:hypothetical protein
MHRAQQYLVHKLDLSTSRAHCRPVKVGYHTSCRNKTTVNILKQLENDCIFRAGSVQVVATVYGYVKVPHRNKLGSQLNPFIKYCTLLCVRSLVPIYISLLEVVTSPVSH